MQDIQSVFIRIQENKKKMKDLKDAYKDALSTSSQYKDITEELKTLREKKKEIEATIRGQFANEWMQIEDLKIDIASDQELMSDIAVTLVMQGQSIAVTDKYENEYEPLIKVTFKKV